MMPFSGLMHLHSAWRANAGHAAHRNELPAADLQVIGVQVLYDPGRAKARELLAYVCELGTPVQHIHDEDISAGLPPRAGSQQRLSAGASMAARSGSLHRPMMRAQITGCGRDTLPVT